MARIAPVTSTITGQPSSAAGMRAASSGVRRAIMTTTTGAPSARALGGADDARQAPSARACGRRGPRRSGVAASAVSFRLGAGGAAAGRAPAAIRMTQRAADAKRPAGGRAPRVALRSDGHGPGLQPRSVAHHRRAADWLSTSPIGLAIAVVLLPANSRPTARGLVVTSSTMQRARVAGVEELLPLFATTIWPVNVLVNARRRRTRSRSPR